MYKHVSEERVVHQSFADHHTCDHMFAFAYVRQNKMSSNSQTAGGLSTEHSVRMPFMQKKNTQHLMSCKSNFASPSSNLIPTVRAASLSEHSMLKPKWDLCQLPFVSHPPAYARRLPNPRTPTQNPNPPRSQTPKPPLSPIDHN